LALPSVGHGEYYDFTKFGPTSMPEAFIGKGTRLSGGAIMNTTTHSFKKSLLLQELKLNFQAGDGFQSGDGIIHLNFDDVADIRTGTQHGMFLLELITRKEKATQNTQTDANTTNTTQTKNIATQAPTMVRMTRSGVAALRNVQTTEDEKRRRRIARAIANIT
jgi:hypothetical protein